MQVIFLKEAHHMKYGRLPKGRVMEGELLRPWVDVWLKDGTIELMQTKVARETPLKEGGPVALSSASPPVPPSPTQTLPSSENGGKRRGRFKKA